MTNSNQENRELGIDELNAVSGGDCIRNYQSIFMPAIMTTKQPTSSDPKPTTTDTTTTTPKSGHFDPVMIRF